MRKRTVSKNNIDNDMSIGDRKDVTVIQSLREQKERLNSFIRIFGGDKERALMEFKISFGYEYGSKRK